MKIVVWCLLIVGVYLGYQFSIGAVFREYQDCYDTAALELASGNVPENQLCVIEKLEYEEMSSCVQSIQQASNLVSFLYQASPAKKDIERDIEIHNEACPVNKIDPPPESFYISSGTSR
ncbi:MAG: hypothetical protein QG639_472 [Patescibacteria group bacterium]|nr:hypothetical protein [Patescibacteria group bacterium]